MTSLNREILRRAQQAWLIISTLLLSWLLMQAIHEPGHVIAAWLSGGRVVQVVLHPLTISRTDVEPNPHPLVAVWSGPIVGAALPFIAWLVAAAAKLPATFLRFFAGFCLVANGAYVGLGSFQRIGDCGVMLGNGSPIWLLWLFGVATIPAGLWLVDGSRRYFSFGRTQNLSNSRSVFVTTIALGALVLIEVFFSPWK